LFSTETNTLKITTLRLITLIHCDNIVIVFRLFPLCLSGKHFIYLFFSAKKNGVIYGKYVEHVNISGQRRTIRIVN